jgi:hypothetical protein
MHPHGFAPPVRFLGRKIRGKSSIHAFEALKNAVL